MADTAAPAFGTQAQFAQANGWAKSYVTALKQDGRLVFNEAGQVDFAASLQRIRDTAGAPERSAPQVQGREYNAAIEVGRFYDNELKRLDYERTVGKVRLAAEVHSVLDDAAATFRAGVEAWARRLPVQLAALGGDEERIRGMLQAEGDQLLRQVAKRFADMAGAASAGGGA